MRHELFKPFRPWTSVEAILERKPSEKLRPGKVEFSIPKDRTDRTWRTSYRASPSFKGIFTSVEIPNRQYLLRRPCQHLLVSNYFLRHLSFMRLTCHHYSQSDTVRSSCTCYVWFRCVSWPSRSRKRHVLLAVVSIPFIIFFTGPRKLIVRWEHDSHITQIYKIYFKHQQQRYTTKYATSNPNNSTIRIQTPLDRLNPTAKKGLMGWCSSSV